MSVAQIELAKLPSEVQVLLDRIPSEYMHDLSLDLAWAGTGCHTAARCPIPGNTRMGDHLEEMELAGDDLSNILQSREEARAGVGMTPEELHAYLKSSDE